MACGRSHRIRLRHSREKRSWNASDVEDFSHSVAQLRVSLGLTQRLSTRTLGTLSTPHKNGQKDPRNAWDRFGCEATRSIMRNLRSWLLIGAVALVVVLALFWLGRSGVRTDSEGLRTFSVSERALCLAARAVDPVTGILRGQRGAQEPVWLENDEGVMSVIWPEGFTVRFEPTAVLYDEKEIAVAKEGDTVILSQINTSEHSGSFEDPYFARYRVFRGCY